MQISFLKDAYSFSEIVTLLELLKSQLFSGMLGQCENFRPLLTKGAGRGWMTMFKAYSHKLLRVERKELPSINVRAAPC